MKPNKSHFVPILTTDAGRSLTVANWEEVDVNTVAYNLASLLMKPGMDLLRSLPDLKTYTGWSSNLVLNAAMPDMNRDGRYTIRSDYDGSRSHYSPDDIIALILQLKPQMVLLPTGIDTAWQALPKDVFPFFSSRYLPTHIDRAHGVYFLHDKSITASQLIEQVEAYADIPRYVSGELDVDLIRELRRLGVEYVSSNVPASDACNGRIYSDNGLMILKSDAYRMDFNTIDETCSCPTCDQQLTRAYLHHLFDHTPLLCQRFLIQHNIRFTTFQEMDITHLRQP